MVDYKTAKAASGDVVKEYSERHEASIHANQRRKVYASLAARNRRFISITATHESPL